MRFDIAKDGSGLVYEIRQIVGIAKQMKDLGIDVTWENIGDPIHKGEKIPAWMKEVLTEILKDDFSYGYCPTKGVDATREFLAERVNQMGKVQITPEDIIFFNGLGDAIARAYSSIRVDARIIMPEPTYSTHLLAEVLHASFPPNTYRMNPYRDWAPDIRELEQKVRSHRSIVGILVINPDNPTGYVHHPDTLKRIVEIAREYDLFLIFDEKRAVTARVTTPTARPIHCAARTPAMTRKNTATMPCIHDRFPSKSVASPPSFRT